MSSLGHWLRTQSKACRRAGWWYFGAFILLAAGAAALMFWWPQMYRWDWVFRGAAIILGVQVVDSWAASRAYRLALEQLAKTQEGNR